MASDASSPDPLALLSAAGVAVWLDDLSRERLSSGNLAALIRDRHVVGITTNPTIFQKAISGADAYATQLHDLAIRGVDVGEALRLITTSDVRWGCDVLRPAYDASDTVDGRVSIEVDPRISGDDAKTLAEARSLWWMVDRPNLFIKIPATLESLPAISGALAEGISVNVTLIFSLERYGLVIDAFFDGLERARAAGIDLAAIGSVASFFVSRVDTEIDKRLDKIGTDEAKALRGKAAVANARLAYELYEEKFAGPRWASLAASGAKVQRPLWASTGVKDPAYDDTMYVVDLVADHTVNTMPEPTLQAVHDHGVVSSDSIRGHYAGARAVLDQLAAVGIDYDDVVLTLEREGVEKFEASWVDLIAAVDKELEQKALEQKAGKLTGMKDASTTVEAGGITVTISGTDLVMAARNATSALVDAGVPKSLMAKDPGLWGPDAAELAATRLGWLDLPNSSRQYIPELRDLHARLAADGIDHVVLAGMGGSSLAPEVIAATAGVRLTVLDTTDAGQVAAAIADRLDRTVLVVSSKSGGTLETDSHRRVYEQAFRDAGIDPVARIVVVTDPGSPLEQASRAAGYRVFLADPNVGGRYSALSAFGLVPTALAGVDVGGLLDDAAALLPALAGDTDNPGLTLGAVLGEAGRAGRDKVVIADFGSRHPGFGDWAEQLVAESTGKQGTGLLPVVVESVESPGFGEAPDRHLVTLGQHLHIDGTTISGSLGAQFLAWEYATAIAGRVLGIDPFDQPNVQESKDNTGKILDESGDGPLPEGKPVFTDGAVEVHTDDPILLGGAHDLTTALSALLRAVPDRGYVAVMAYLDRHEDSAAALVRRSLARQTDRPVTFGWAPRFLHSTGQYHKGGPQTGAFLQITGVVTRDLAIPGRPFGFARLQMAQALGDLRALQQRGRPAIRLHLLDRTQGLQELLDAAGNAR